MSKEEDIIAQAIIAANEKHGNNRDVIPLSNRAFLNSIHEYLGSMYGDNRHRFKQLSSKVGGSAVSSLVRYRNREYQIDYSYDNHEFTCLVEKRYK